METFRWHGKHSSNSDVAEHVRSCLLKEPAITALLGILDTQGSLFAVGGIIRDLLLDKQVLDIDLATPLRPETVMTRLKKEGVRVVETGIEHGTVLAVIEGTHVEITTFRAPSSRSKTEYSSTIEEDLAGRDFTINAMAVPLAEGPLVDPWSGRQHLGENKLVAVGDAARRFSEDPLRLLRYIRFGSAQGRTTDDAIRKAAQTSAQLLGNVHQERIQKELSQILLSPYAGAGIREMENLGLLKAVLPELLPSVGCEQNRFHIHDVFEHTLWVLDRCPSDDLILRLTALLHDAGKPATLTVDEQGERHFYLHEKVSEELAVEALSRLRYPKKTIETTARLVRHHMRPLDCGPSGARRIMRDLGDDLARWRRFKCADSPPVMPPEEFAKLEKHFDTLVENEQHRLDSIIRIPINGHDIMTLGVKEGPHIGEILNHLRELTIETPEMSRHDTLREEARRYAIAKGYLSVA